MPRASDATLSEAQICEINGLSQSRRQKWAERGRVREAPAAGCQLSDAVELAALKLVADQVQTGIVDVVWDQLQEQIRDAIVGSRADAVIDLQFKSVTVVRDDRDLRAATSHGRPVQVLALAEVCQPVAEAFKRLTRERPPVPTRGSAGSTSRRRSRGG